MNLLRKEKRCLVKNVAWITGIASLFVINGEENVIAAIYGSKGVFKCLKT